MPTETNTVSSWGNTLMESTREIWMGIASVVPKLLGALVVLIIGWLIAIALAALVKRLASMAHLDRGIERTGIMDTLSKYGLAFQFSNVLAWLIKWFIIVVVITAVADILQWNQVTNFLRDVALYIPRVIIGVIMLTIGFIAGQFIHEVIRRTVIASHVIADSAASPIAAVAKWAIIIFTFMAVLVQLGIAAGLIQILFAGIIAMLALAGGLAFGLGGRDKARELLDRINQQKQ